MSTQKNDNQSVETVSSSGSSALQAGTKLQLQFTNEPERGRYQVTIIGYVEGRSILTTAPVSKGNVILLREAQEFIVRTVSGKQIISFKSEVKKVYHNPFSYIHLKPPEEVAQLVIRNAYRVDMDVIASVYCVERNEQTGELSSPASSFSAKISNMSTTGCAFQMLDQLPENSKEIIVSTKVKVAEQEKMINVEGIIRSHRELKLEDEIWHVYGIEYNEMSDDKRLLLYCYVCEQLVRVLYKE